MAELSWVSLRLINSLITFPSRDVLISGFSRDERLFRFYAGRLILDLSDTDMPYGSENGDEGDPSRGVNVIFEYWFFFQVIRL